MAGLVPATPIIWHSRAPLIGVAGTSPAMTLKVGRGPVSGTRAKRFSGSYSFPSNAAKGPSP
jgi:hypothetical protein